jgi:hypothetical protein
VIPFPDTVHWLELISSLISGPGMAVLAWVAWDARKDRRAIPRDRHDLFSIARYAVEAADVKTLCEAGFFWLSIRAMTLPPATTTREGAPDLGAIFSVVVLIGVEVALLFLGLRNVQMRRKVREEARKPYLGPNRRKA